MQLFRKPFLLFTTDDGNELVAFTAIATTERYYGKDDIVLFDAAVSNFGGHYNTVTSTFVCPYSGVYLFSISVYSIEGVTLYLEFMKNNAVMIDIMSYDETIGSNSGAVFILECEVGDIIWVKCDSDNDAMESDGTRRSHFSGVLLHRNN